MSRGPNRSGARISSDTKVFSGHTSDPILTPEDLFNFAQQDSTNNLFYLSSTTIDRNTKHYDLLNQWRYIGNEDEITCESEMASYRSVLDWKSRVRTQNQFDPIRVGEIQTHFTSSSSTVQTNTLDI